MNLDDSTGPLQDSLKWMKERKDWVKGSSVLAKSREQDLWKVLELSMENWRQEIMKIAITIDSFLRF